MAVPAEEPRMLRKGYFIKQVESISIIYSTQFYASSDNMRLP